MHEGVGNCLIAANFFSNSCVGDDVSREFYFLFPSQFFCEMVMLIILHLSKTVCVLMTSSSSVSAHMMVSSTSFLAQGRPSTIMSDDMKGEM